MIQRTRFNRITIDRIEELFAPHFRGTIDAEIQCWREAMADGEIAGRQFYISLNAQWEMDGILMYDEAKEEGVIYARTKEVTHDLLERVLRSGGLLRLTGDPAACRWAAETKLFAQ